MKSDSNVTYNVMKDFFVFSNKCCSGIPAKKKKSIAVSRKNMKQLFSTLIITRNDS